MKKYKKVIEKPRLVVKHDTCGDSPREWSNLGLFLTFERNNSSPDDNENYKWIKELMYLAECSADHYNKIMETFEENGEKIKYMEFVSKYEHSGVTYSLGVSRGWDEGVCGFYIVFENDETKDMTEEQIEKIIKSELDTYSQYANGEVYEFTEYDEDGKEVQSVGGYYDMDQIKEYLEDETIIEKGEDVSDFLIYD